MDWSCVADEAVGSATGLTLPAHDYAIRVFLSQFFFVHFREFMFNYPLGDFLSVWLTMVAILGAIRAMRY